VGLCSWEIRDNNAADRNATERDASLSYLAISNDEFTDIQANLAEELFKKLHRNAVRRW